MRFDGFDTMEGRHLVFAYATVIIIQVGYFARVTVQFFKMSSGKKKTTKPL